MGSYKYASDITERISQVCDAPATQIHFEYPETDLDGVFQFLQRILNFVKDSYSAVGSQQYLLKLDFHEDINSNFLNGSRLLEELTKGKNVFRIDHNLSLIKSSEWRGGFSNEELSLGSKTNSEVWVFNKNGIDLMILCKGIILKEVNAARPEARAVVYNKFSRQAEDYKLSLIDFYKSKVRTNVTSHWSDANRRILKGSQTEDIFQLALVTWLQDNLVAKKINMKVKKLSADETDIEIIKHGGDSFLIEIKWLGENSTNTKYTVSKIGAAFHQLINYLEQDTDVLEATVVVYDGRSLADFDKLMCIEEDTGNWKILKQYETVAMPVKGNCYVFHLISQSASVRKSS